MDAIRRWQIATVVTAVTGLGIGALAVGQQPAHQVDSIELTPSPTATAPRVVDDEPHAEDTEIVTPDVQSLETSVLSLDSPDASSDPTQRDSSPSTSPPGPSAPTAPVDDGASTVSTDSPHGPDSIESPGSVDSGGSLDT
jgi:hypothetical protein